MLAWESILAEGHANATFKKYPKVANDHHLLEFMTGALQGAMEGNDAANLQALLDTEIHVFEEKHHAAVMAMTRTADGLPGFGIVAAVLGIVVTMGAIGGPVEEIGHKVGAALVGTFLGILMSYGRSVRWPVPWTPSGTKKSLCDVWLSLPLSALLAEDRRGP